MGARPLPLSHSSRRTLSTQGMHESIRARSKNEAGLTGPLCIYKLCETHGVTVRFVDVNMEGMYQRSAAPRIFISSLRPVARRAFNCAHELGHHLFGHGSTVDQLYEELSKEDRDTLLTWIEQGCPKGDVKDLPIQAVRVRILPVLAKLFTVVGRHEDDGLLKYSPAVELVEQ